MKKSVQKIILAVLLGFAGRMAAQYPLSGTYNVPGTYSTVGAAINALNIYGVLGPVVINVSAGYTETVTAGGYTLNNVVGSSSVNTITFQKSGAGVNPILYAFAGGANTPASASQDGVWRFIGSDYITIDGIDITDPNTSNPSTMEFGYGFFKANVADGCQFNTIKNCTITLSTVNNTAGSGPAADGSRGIDVVNATTGAHTTNLTITSANGANSNNKFYNNLIQKCNYGISILGYADVSPFNNADNNNDIGGSSAATSNTIVNFGGGGTVASSAVRTLAQYNLNVSYNSINNNTGSNTNHTGALRGIYVNSATSANVTINNNTITVKGGGTTTQLSAIENLSGATAANNTITINNNQIVNCTYTTATSGVWYGIYNNGASAANLSINGNTFNNNSTNATSGSYYNIYNTGAVTNSITITSNTISAVTFSAASTSLTNYNIIYTGSSASAIVNINNNTLSGISYVGATGGTGAWAGIYCNASTSVSTIQGNLLNNLSIKTTGVIYLIYHSQSSQNVSVNSNSIVTAFARTAAGSSATYFYYNLSGSPTNPSFNFFNNNFSNYNNGTNTGALYMLYTYYGALTTNIYGNVCSNITASSGTSSMYMIYGPYYSATNNIYNNTWSNITYGTGNIYMMYFYNYYGTASNIYGNTWNNIVSSGTNYGIYYYYPGGITTGGVFNFYRNKISDVTTNGTSTSLYGMYILGYYAGQTVNIYNNVIGNLYAPSSINSQAISGMYILPQASYNLNVYNNSVYLTGTSGASGFGSNGIYTSSSYNMTFANNLIVNNCAATGVGQVVAHRRLSSTISTYNTGSDNNLYYAGVPSATNMIYSDGVNNLQTLASYKSFMAGKEAAAVTENPPFAVLTGSSSTYLSISGSTTTQIESGALPIAGLTTDFAGNTRSATAPDIGAWEGNYLNPNPTCSGAPSAGTIAVSPAAGCANTPYAVSVSGQTGLNTPGISYVWQSSGSASGPWTTLSGISGPSFQQPGSGSSIFYRIIVTCSASAQSATSAVVGYTANTCIASFTLTDAYGDGWNGGLMAVVVNGQTTTIGSGFTTGTSFITTACLPPSSAYSLYLTSPGSYATEMGINMDIGGSTFTIVGANSGGPLSSATAGSLLTTGTTCGAPVTCSNVVSGSITAAASSGCANQPLLLTGTGLTSGLGIVYQWQTASSSSGPWTAISGATNTAYTATPSTLSYYRLVTTCTVSSNSATTGAAGYTVNSCAATLTLTDSYGDGWNGGLMALVVNGQTTTIGSGFTTGTSQTVSICLPTAATYSLIFTSVGSYPTEMGVVLNMGGSPIISIVGANSGGPLSTATTGSVLSTGLSCLCNAANGGTITTTSYSICGNSSTLNLTPTGASGGTGITYAWQASPVSGSGYTNVTTGSGTNTSSYTTPTLSAGNYYYRMMATCNGTINGPSNEVTVTVVAPSSPSIVSTTSVVCAGNTATLSASGASSYTWNTGATTSSIVVTPTNSSYYFVTGAGSSPCPNVVGSNLPVYYSQTPTVSATSNTAQVCAGNPATLTASGAVTYSWSSSATTASAVVSPTTTTTYTVTGYYPGGCNSNTTVPITANPKPALNTSGSTGICTGQNASVTVTGASTYSWNTGATTNSIVTTPPTGVTIYTVTGTDALGCTNTISHTVNVAASLSISIVGPSSICIGQTASLAGNGGVTYTWNTGATTSSIAPSPTITTTYSIIGASGTCSNTGVKTITVNANPTITIAGGTVICVGQTTTLTASGASTYLWNNSSTATSVAISPSVNTSYSVVGTSAVGCTASANAAVVSNTLPVITVAQSSSSICVNSPATFTASGATTYTWYSSATGNTISITPTSSAVYSLTGTNPAGCVSSGTFALGAYALPVISIVPSSATVCSLSQASFVASGASTYTWNGSSSATVATYTSNPASSTVYTVVGTNVNGCVNNATVAVTTNTLPIIAIAPPSATICAFGSTSFTASGANTYTWSNNSTNTTISVSQSNNATYTVNGTNAEGCVSSGTVGLTALPLPTVVITPSVFTACAFSTVSLTISGASTYSWSTSSTNTMVTVTPSALTSYSAVGTDSNNCSNVANAVILTNALPTISLSASSPSVCSLTTVTVSASGANTYTWSGGATGISTTYTPASNSVYTATGTDANGCVNSGTIAVTAASLPTLVISASAASVCPGSSASFTVTGADTYSWIPVSSNASIVVVTPTAAAVYSVSGTDLVGCINSKTVSLGLFNLPTLSVTPQTSTICASEVATLNVSGAGTYTWQPGSGSGTTFTASPVILTQYTVTGTDANNCVNSTTVAVFVDACTGLSKLDANKALISVFPNPTNGMVNARFDYDGVKEILILDETGRAVEMRVTEERTESFDLSKYAKGMYLVRIQSKSATGYFKISVK